MLTRLDEITTAQSLLEVCLEIARRVAYPELRTPDALTEFRAMAAPLMPDGEPSRVALERLSQFYAGVLGFRPNTENYYTPDNSYLNMVLRRRTGIPITLAIVYMALAERAGLHVVGVSAPGHFLCRCDLPGGPLFIDAFHQGRLMTQNEALVFLRETVREEEITSRSLHPSNNREVIRRLLSNLKPIYLRRHQLPVVARVLEVATELMPDDPRHWVERSAVLTAMGERRLAADLATRSIFLGDDRELSAQRRQLLGLLRDQHLAAN